MKIAVAGMKHIRDPQPRLTRHLADPFQSLTEFSPRHHAVLHDEVGREPAHRAESALAAFPNRQPLGGVTGDFIDDPVSMAAGKTFHWLVKYNPNDVTLLLANITVPEPTSTALAVLGAMALLVGRRSQRCPL